MVAMPYDSETPARLRAVVGKLSRRLSSAARGSGLTQAQLSALGVVARVGPIRLSDLAEAEGLHPTMLSRVVAALEEQDLLRRRTDPGDRRAALVEVTAAGRRSHDKLRAQRGRILAEALEQLTPEQVAAIEAALPALESLVEASKGMRVG
jgi:DNA-binding MarR family transcriptional regulator